MHDTSPQNAPGLLGDTNKWYHRRGEPFGESNHGESQGEKYRENTKYGVIPVKQSERYRKITTYKNIIMKDIENSRDLKR